MCRIKGQFAEGLASQPVSSSFEGRGALLRQGISSASGPNERCSPDSMCSPKSQGGV